MDGQPQTIRSATTTERWVRALCVLALTAGFSAAFLYDGHLGYARKNARALAQLLGLPPDRLPEVRWGLSARMGRGWVEQIRRAKGVVDVPRLSEELEGPGLHREDFVYFLGPGGWLRVEAVSGKATAAEWTDGPKTEMDQKWQRWIGYALAAAALAALGNLLRVVFTRVTVEPTGLPNPLTDTESATFPATPRMTPPR